MAHWVAPPGDRCVANQNEGSEMVVVPETGGIGAPVVVSGPWTREARQASVDREMLQLFILYFGRSMRTRRWSPWHDLPVDEIRELGPRLSEDTIDLVEGFY